MQPRVGQLAANAHAAGHLRRDLGADDLPVIQLMLSAAMKASTPIRVDMWERCAALVLGALEPRAEDRPLPGREPTGDEARAMIQRWRLSHGHPAHATDRVLSVSLDTELRAYVDRAMTPPAAEVVQAIAGGPIDPADALDRHTLDRLLDPAPLTGETGWCTLADGVGYTAVTTEMPGVTGEMVDWWFDWHQRDSLRYQLWYPGAHLSICFEPPRHAGAKSHWGAVDHAVEDIGLGVDQLRIAFEAPMRVGFSTDALDDPRVATIVGGFVGSDRLRMRHTLIVHVFLTSPSGVRLRSRFWMGAALRPYAPAPVADLAARLLNHQLVRARLIPKRAPRAMAEHCAAEYANLAAVLPELYERYAAPTAIPARTRVMRRRSGVCDRHHDLPR